MKKTKKNKSNQPVSEHKEIEFDSNMLKNEDWLTTEGLMDYLKISRSKIYELRKKRMIPSLKIGNAPMFPKMLLNKILLPLAQQSLNNDALEDNQ